MANTTLSAQKREGTGKGVARKLRQAGRVPAVLYGRELDALHLSIDAHEADILFHSVSIENTIVELAVEGVKEPFQTLVREIQTHPLRDTLLHVDFLRIQTGVAVDVEIPIHLNGVPAGVRLGGGILEQIIHELPIRCVPADIPHEIAVDVTGLELNQSIHVGDLDLGEGIEITIPSDQTICAVAAPRAEVEEVEEEAVEGTEPEVIGGVEEGEESEEEEG